MFTKKSHIATQGIFVQFIYIQIEFEFRNVNSCVGRKTGETEQNCTKRVSATTFNALLASLGFEPEYTGEKCTTAPFLLSKIKYFSLLWAMPGIFEILSVLKTMY